MPSTKHKAELRKHNLPPIPEDRSLEITQPSYPTEEKSQMLIDPERVDNIQGWGPSRLRQFLKMISETGFERSKRGVYAVRQERRS